MFHKKLDAILIVVTIILVSSLQALSQSQIDNYDSLHNSTINESKKFASTDLLSKNYGMGLSMFLPNTFHTKFKASPLVVIDNVPYPELSLQNIDLGTTSISEIAQLLNIPYSSIDTIELSIANPEFAAFGSLGSNGVISIKTKKEIQKAFSVDYTYRHSFKMQEKGYELLDGEQYSNLIQESYLNTYGYPLSTTTYKEFLYSPDEPYYYYNYSNNTDWQSLILQLGLEDAHDIMFHGNFNKFSYLWANNFTTETGTIINTKKKNYNSLFNLNYTPVKFIKLKFNGSYKQGHQNNYNSNESNFDFYVVAVKKMPNMSAYEYKEDGTRTNNYFNDPENAQGGNIYNPLDFENTPHYYLENRQSSSSFAFELSPSKKFSYTSSITYQTQQNSWERYSLNSVYLTDENQLRKTIFFNQYILFQPELKGRSHIQMEGSHLFMKGKLNDVTTKINHKLFDETNNSYIIHYYDSIYFKQEFSYHEYNFRFAYEWDHKYKANILINTLGNYSVNYTISTEWISSNEEFINDISFIDYLSASLYLKRYDITLPPNIETRTTNSKELNISAKLMKRFNLNFFLFSKNTTSKLYNSPIPAILSGRVLNMSTELRQIGWELHANLNAVSRNNFKLDFSANIYHVNNQYYNDIAQYYYWSIRSFQNRNIESSKNGNIIGLNYQGVYQYNEFIEGIQESAPVARDRQGKVLKDEENNSIGIYTEDGYRFVGGDAIYEDTNFDGFIDDNDAQIIGNTKPIVEGTFGSSIRYKQLWLGAFFNFSVGNDIVNLAQQTLTKMARFDNQSIDVLDRWRKDGDQTNIPRAAHHHYENNYTSSRYVQNGSFMRLKALTLKYDLSEKELNKLHVKNMSIFITAKNVLTLTKYKGANPELAMPSEWTDYGYDNNYQGVTKQVTLGINIGF